MLVHQRVINWVYNGDTTKHQWRFFRWIQYIYNLGIDNQQYDDGYA